MPLAAAQTLRISYYNYFYIDNIFYKLFTQTNVTTHHQATPDPTQRPLHAAFAARTCLCCLDVLVVVGVAATAC